jgi:hypothetical protein
MCIHHDLAATGHATEPADIGLGSAADGAMAAPRIAFRIGIGAGSILLLIAAALLLGASLSKAVAMDSSSLSSGYSVGLYLDFFRQIIYTSSRERWAV